MNYRERVEISSDQMYRLIFLFRENDQEIIRDVLAPPLLKVGDFVRLRQTVKGDKIWNEEIRGNDIHAKIIQIDYEFEEHYSASGSVSTTNHIIYVVDKT